MKMTFITTIILLTASSLFAQNNASSGFVLEGNFLQDYSGYIYLRYDDKTDSALVSNQKFTFRGKAKNEITSAALFVNVKSRVNIIPAIYLENTSIRVTLSLEDKTRPDGKILAYLQVVSVEGTKTALIERQYQEFYEKHRLDPNFSKLLLSKANELITADPSSPFSGTMFFRLAAREDIDKTTLIELYSKLRGNSLSELQKRKTESSLFPEKFVHVNDVVFDFSLPDQKGQLFNTASLKGKWYLIDFWASWCGPCRAQLPELKRVYNLNKEKNFQVLGVSIDEKKEAWLKALATEELSWINVIENAHFFGGQIASKYQVTSVPMNFLINPDGRIVAKNISLNKLEEQLKTID